MPWHIHARIGILTRDLFGLIGDERAVYSIVLVESDRRIRAAVSLVDALA